MDSFYVSVESADGGVVVRGVMAAGKKYPGAESVDFQYLVDDFYAARAKVDELLLAHDNAVRSYAAAEE